MMSQDFDYDLVIIGVGVGGYGVVFYVVKCGLKIVIIEVKDMGGICVNWGCIFFKVFFVVFGWVWEMFD